MPAYIADGEQLGRRLHEDMLPLQKCMDLAAQEAREPRGPDLGGIVERRSVVSAAHRQRVGLGLQQGLDALLVTSGGRQVQRGQACKFRRERREGAGGRLKPEPRCRWGRFASGPCFLPRDYDHVARLQGSLASRFVFDCHLFLPPARRRGLLLTNGAAHPSGHLAGRLWPLPATCQTSWLSLCSAHGAEKATGGCRMRLGGAKVEGSLHRDCPAGSQVACWLTCREVGQEAKNQETLCLSYSGQRLLGTRICSMGTLWACQPTDWLVALGRPGVPSRLQCHCCIHRSQSNSR